MIICRTSLNEIGTKIYFGLFIVLIIISIVSFIVIKGNINDLLKEDFDDEYLRKKYKYQKYIWCFAQLLMISNFVIYRIKQRIDNYNYNALFYIDQILELISLFLLLIVYAFTKVVMIELKERLCCCCVKKNNQKDLFASFIESGLTEM